jgi:hypothetical protein
VKSPREVDELTATAYHEAGHAVIGYANGFGCYSVSVVSDDTSLGRYRSKPFEEALEPDCVRDPRTMRLTRKLIVVELAGFAAESRLTGAENWEGAADDKRNAVHRCFNLRAHPDDVARLFAELLEQAKTAVGRRRKWRAIEILAAEVLRKKELEAEEIERLIAPVLHS